MIEVSTIKINSLSDYEQLLNGNLINGEYIDSSVVNTLQKYIGEKCKAISIEYPYYDNDYLSGYYALYAKKHKQYSKKCYRLMFFSDTRATELMGYITLRPTHHGTHLCKVMFEPYKLLEENANLILSKEKVHFMGGECELNVFPQMGQEGAVSACAHVSVWSILRSFANRFQNFGIHRIADIANKVVQYDRKNIPSDGLTIKQISSIFTQNGFSPIVIRRENETFDDEIISYLESGIPLVGVLSGRTHAVAMIGICESDNKSREMPATYTEKIICSDALEYNVTFHSKFVPGVYVNDDHLFPYGMIKKFIPPCANITNNTTNYVMRDIDFVIVPLHHRIYMYYKEVRTFFINYLKSKTKNLGWDSSFVARIFLASSNRYKEYIRSQGNSANRSVVDILIAMEAPKFMWCIEISSYDKYKNNIVDHIILLDSTSSPTDGDPILFLSGSNFVEYKNDESFEHLDVDLRNGLGLKAFDNLLEKVECDYEQNKVL